MRSVLALLVLGLVAACSSSPSSTSGGTSGVTSSTGGIGVLSTSGAGSGGSSSGSPGGSGATSVGTSGGGPSVFTVTFPAITVGAGAEVTQCVVLSLGNTSAVHIGEIHNVLTDGAIDFIVYRASDASPTSTPFDCPTYSHFGSAGPDSALILSNKADDDLRLPAGVGLTLQPSQLVRLELHAYNGSEASEPVSATATLTAMPEATFQTEAAFLAMEDVDINVAPNSTATTQGFLPVPAEIGTGLTVAQIAGYTRSHGQQVKLQTSSNKAGPFTLLYDPSGWVWNDSPRLDDDPEASLPAGNGFQLECDYNNTTPSTLSFGPSVTEEACLFQAYVYPSSGAHICLHTDQGGGTDQCCPMADAGCSLF